jgi:diguanylate cyclase (GGDEF)-like protein
MASTASAVVTERSNRVEQKTRPAHESRRDLRIAGGVFAYLTLCTLVQYTPGLWPEVIYGWFGDGPGIMLARWGIAVVVGVALVRQWRSPLRYLFGFLAAASTLGALASVLLHLGDGSEGSVQAQRLALALMYACIAGAIRALPSRPEAGRDPVLIGLDSLLMGGVAVLLVWFYFIQPGGDDSLRFPGEASALAMLARLGYPVLDALLLLLLFLQPTMRRTGALRAIFAPLTFGVVCILAGDTLIFLGNYLDHPLLEILAAGARRTALVGFLLTALRAWRPLEAWAPARFFATSRRLWTLSASAVVGLFAAMFVEVLDHGHPHLITMSIGATLAGLLLLLRQAVMQRRRDALVARQRQELELRVAERTAELAAAKSRLELLASEDSLTGLANRRAFDDALATAWSSCARSRQPLSIALLDIDFFKAYNDHFGHAAGDACLQNVSRVLQRIVRRRTDLVARYGGEEFLLLMPQTDAEGAMLFAERVRQAVEAEAFPHAPQVPHGVVTISVGVVSAEPDPVSLPESLFFAADAALYEAKAEGRNCVRRGKL